MASKHMKRCSISLTIKEIKIKTTMKYHFIPTTIAALQSKMITSVSKGMEKLKPSCTGGEYKLVRLLWKTVWSFLKWLCIEVLYD